MSAAPERALPTVEALKPAPPDVLSLLRERLGQAGGPANARERLRAACALSILGAPVESLGGLPGYRFLVDRLGDAPATESAVLVEALRAAAVRSPEVVADLSARAAAEADPPRAVRYTAALLSLGHTDAARRMLALGPDPTTRTAFVAEFGAWRGDLKAVDDLLRRIEDDDFRSGLCAAVGRVDPQSLSTAERLRLELVLADLYRGSPHGGVHSASGWALRQWRVPLPDPPRSRSAPPGHGWFVNRSGMTMVLAPAGFAVLGEPQAGQPSVPVLLTRAYFVADREVPYEVFSEFASDRSLSEDERPAGWSLDPGAGALRLGLDVRPAAKNFTWSEALRFCNWLSRREGRQPCYRRADRDRDVWEYEARADGYRIPTWVEWEYACRAGSARRWVASDDPGCLLDYAAASTTAARPGGRLPNGWGLFDTLGGLWEFTWDVRQGGGPLVNPTVPPQQRVGDRRGMYGGAYNSGSYDQQAGYGRTTGPTDRGSIGLRVVCPAGADDVSGYGPTRPGLPAGSPAAAVDFLWARAADARPDDPRLVAIRGGMYARRARFAAAAADLVRAWESTPGDQALWYAATAVRLYVNDVVGARRACRAALDRLPGPSGGPVDAHRYAQAALLGALVPPDPAASPSEAIDPAALRATIDLAIRRSPGAPGELPPFLAMTKGMAEYRAGADASAVSWAEKAIRASSGSPVDIGIIESFRAMALHRLGRTAEARSVLAAAVARVEAELPAADSGDVGPAWGDWLVCQVARREAEALVFGTPAGRPASGPTTRPAARP